MGAGNRTAMARARRDRPPGPKTPGVGDDGGMTAPAPRFLRTPAWLLVGLTGSRPGVLELADGRLAFTAEDGRVFEAARRDITDVVFPWFYFGGGVKLTVAGTRHRLSFVRPNGAEDVPARLVDGTADVAGGALALLTAHEKLRDIGEGRAAGKAWKAALLAPA